MRYLFFFLLLLLFSFKSLGQNCTDDIQPQFEDGEKLHYILQYNWGFIWFKAGEVFFEAKDTTFNGNAGFVFRSHGKSMPNWDWFYHVDAKYESHTDENINPFRFTRKGNEGSHYYHNEYSITPSNAHLKATDKEGNITEKNITLSPCTFDVMSAIYYCRSVKFENYNFNDLIPLNLFLDGEFHQSQLRYIGKEKWTNPTTDKKYDCILFKPLLISGSVFKSGENMTVYVTDDESKIPVYIVTELKVGKAKIFLEEY